jgi:hypothetical protein
VKLNAFKTTKIKQSNYKVRVQVTEIKLTEIAERGKIQKIPYKPEYIS